MLPISPVIAVSQNVHGYYVPPGVHDEAFLSVNVPSSFFVPVWSKSFFVIARVKSLFYSLRKTLICKDM